MRRSGGCATTDPARAQGKEHASSEAEQSNKHLAFAPRISTVLLTEHGGNQLKEGGPERAHQPGTVACACYSSFG
jgi:hypothetical protein